MSRAGGVAASTLTTRALVLTVIAVVMTVGVYGFVAGIVKLDDGGLALSRRADGFSRAVGRAILAGAPFLMKLLSIVGTAAMFPWMNDRPALESRRVRTQPRTDTRLPTGWCPLSSDAISGRSTLDVLTASDAWC